MPIHVDDLLKGSHGASGGRIRCCLLSATLPILGLFNHFPFPFPIPISHSPFPHTARSM
jgi:hypothetical protein